MLLSQRNDLGRQPDGTGRFQKTDAGRLSQRSIPFCDDSVFLKTPLVAVKTTPSSARRRRYRTNDQVR